MEPVLNMWLIMQHIQNTYYNAYIQHGDCLSYVVFLLLDRKINGTKLPI